MKPTTTEELYEAIWRNPLFGLQDTRIANTIQAISERETNGDIWVAHAAFMLGVMMGRRDERQRRRTGKGIFEDY